MSIDDNTYDGGTEKSQFEQDLDTVASVVAGAVRTVQEDDDRDFREFTEEANDVAREMVEDTLQGQTKGKAAMACWLVILNMAD